MVQIKNFESTQNDDVNDDNQNNNNNNKKNINSEKEEEEKSASISSFSSKVSDKEIQLVKNSETIIIDITPNSPSRKPLDNSISNLQKKLLRNILETSMIQSTCFSEKIKNFTKNYNFDDLDLLKFQKFHNKTLNSKLNFF